MHFLVLFNKIITILFFVCYSYQFLYIPLVFLLKDKTKKEDIVLHDFAILICARNEESVIGDLLSSIKKQTYPCDKYHIFVIADNCDDHTAMIACENGAYVYERYDNEHIGKGYALKALLQNIKKDHPNSYDAYVVFDADNLLASNYLEELNKCFSRGNDIITTYRNSKNFDTNWISSAYSIWFLRESVFLNYPRSLIGSSAMVSGTGFLFSEKIASQIIDWPYHTLTEDVEFSIDQIIGGKKIAFCKEAVFYDEQPFSFKQSVVQRLRWSRGYLQVFKKYYRGLFRGVLKGDFACFDMTMTIMPAYILSVLSLLCNVLASIISLFIGEDVLLIVVSFCGFLLRMYLLFFVIGLITVISEWKMIRCSVFKKIIYLFSFPLFMFTYLPISFAALFIKPKWRSIKHCVSANDFMKCRGKR